jgi:hypothetical protein
VLCVPVEAKGYRDGEGPRLVDRVAVDMAPFAPHAIDLDRDLLVHAAGRKIHVVRGLSGGAPTASVVKLGWLTTIHAITLIDGVVYAGGQGGGDMLGWIDPLGEARWHRLLVPEHVTTFGKGIDGFALHGSRLVAVDDIVLPRYLLVYDVRNPRAPVLLEVRDLPAHSSAEHIQSVASDGTVMALLSSSANHGWMGQHVGLYDLASLEERAVLHAERRGSFRRTGERQVELASVAIAEGTLWIAARADGLGVLDARPWLSPARTPATIPLDRVRFVPVAAGRVEGVVPVARRTALAVVGRRRPDSVMVSLDGVE